MATNDMEEKPCMDVQPEPEHKWLEKFIGEWTVETEARMEPDKPLVTFSGVESVRSLGGLWILAEGKGEMPGGGTAAMMLTLGYDPQKKRFVGTWIGSMMTHLWLYEGLLDADGKTLTLDCEGPDMAVPGKSTKYRDVYEITDNDHRILTSHVLADDGAWWEMMKSIYRRI